MESLAREARAMPNHPESERSVLGAMLRSNEAALLVLESLTEDDFYDPANREVYSAMRALSETGRALDLVTLDAELSSRGKLEAVGGAQYLIELVNAVPSASNVRAYIRIVDERSTLRKLIRAAEDIVNMSYEGERETRDILESAERAIYDIAMRKGGEQLKPIQPILLNTFEKIEELVKNHGRIEGVPTGYSELDDMLTGLHAGELVLIAARPSMGKTSFGMNIVENAAIRAGKKAAVFSLEMPAEQLAMRMLCTEAKVDMQRVRRGQISDEEWGKLSEAMIAIGPSGMFVDASSGVTVAEVRSKARRLQLEQGLDLIMIDYIQLMTASGRFGSRQEEVSAISRSLKGLATELGVPVIALSQLSRAPTGRANHRPMLSDIRESGAIEQDADVVMFIHREDYYEPETAEKNIAEIIIAKQRNGALGTVKLGWKGEYTWFMDLSPRAREARRPRRRKNAPRRRASRGRDRRSFLAPGGGAVGAQALFALRAIVAEHRSAHRAAAQRARVRRAVAHGAFHHRHPKHPFAKSSPARMARKAFRALAVSVCSAEGRFMRRQRFTQTMRLPHSSMESSTVARSQGSKGLTTHTGGAAGMPCGAQGGQGGGGGGQPQGRGGLQPLGGLRPQGRSANRGIRTIGASGARSPGQKGGLRYMGNILSGRGASQSRGTVAGHGHTMPPAARRSAPMMDILSLRRAIV